MAPAIVIGPGAVGLVLAGSLKRASVPVILVGRARPAPRPRAKPGAIFLCVKAAGLHWAISRARALAGPRTPVVSLLNGLRQVGPVLAAFGPVRSVFGICNFAAQRLGRSSARRLGGRTIRLARDAANAPSARLVRDLLRRAGWDSPLEPDRDRMLWKKLVFNAAVNPVSALACAPSGELARDPALRELVARAVGEGVSAARTAGHRLSQRALLRRTFRSCRTIPGHRSSMLQDLDAGRRTEIEDILGPILSASRRAGLPCPILRSLYKMVLRLESSLKGTHRPAEGA